jgi:aminoglycoside/choline kinase family phosphotransferase
VNASSFPNRYYPWYRDALTDAPIGAARTKLWRRAIEIWHTEMPDYRPNLLHRDFHPGNVLWRRGSAHVVDWANACAGPWGCDVAHCRDNLIRLGGVEVADAFLERYLEVAGVDYEPFWEIASVLEHSPESFDEARLATSEQRLGPAVAVYG